jgi:hypothetical protein
MTDLHVSTLYFKISSEGRIEYRNPKPMYFENNLGCFDLSEEELKITPCEHFQDQQSALHAVEPFLKSWEIESDLTSNIGTIRFKFERSEIIERDPPKPSETIIGQFHSNSVTVMGCDGTITSVRSTYPDPPSNFDTSQNIEIAYRRWLGFKEGKESLQSMAYFVLTILQQNFNGNKKAAGAYNIEIAVLKKIGELSSTRGDATTARKVSASFMQLSSVEMQWLEESVKKLICQMGIYVSGSTPSKLKMEGLPKL